MTKLPFYSLSFFILLMSSNAFSGQSGYILNGKTIITHIDGKEVTQPQEVAESAKETSSKRSPAAKVPGLLHFDEDTVARCYWLSNQSSLQCIKK